MVCKICAGESVYLFDKKVLSKYDVKYFRCTRCEFIQTEKVFWFDEAYNNIITSLDLGLINRNLHIYPIVGAIISKFFDDKGSFLDYGGGYGLLVRIMRDEGFDFYRQDKFCKNIFATDFDIEDVSKQRKFELITAFELFEHFNDPLHELRTMLEYGDSVFFSTELQPGKNLLTSWEYLTPETGQHISLYSHRTLQEIAKIIDVNLYSNQKTLHLLTPRKISNGTFQLLVRRKGAMLYNALFSNRDSFLQKDYNAAKVKLDRR